MEQSEKMEEGIREKPADIIKCIRMVKNDMDIEESVNLESDNQSVLQRYYKPMYCLKIDEEEVDHHCILFHSNRICLLTIAPSHPLLTLNKTVEKINCNVNGSLDRLKNKVSGKGKRGGQKLQPKTILCQIECTDGSTYKIRSCIKGKLIEMNQNLINDPSLLLSHPNTNGHIAVLLSNLNTIDECKKHMLTAEEYKNSI